MCKVYTRSAGGTIGERKSASKINELHGKNAKKGAFARPLTVSQVRIDLAAVHVRLLVQVMDMYAGEVDPDL